MKKVRFETPSRFCKEGEMETRECHSPRPFNSNTRIFEDQMDLCYQYKSDPPHTSNELFVKEYDSNNSSPYPGVNKVFVEKACVESKFSPSCDLDLSILDSCERQPIMNSGRMFIHENHPDKLGVSSQQFLLKNNIEFMKKPINCVTDNGFFIRHNMPLTTFSLNNAINGVHNTTSSAHRAENQLLSNSETPNEEYKNEIVSKHAENIIFCKCHHCYPVIAKNLATSIKKHEINNCACRECHKRCIARSQNNQCECTAQIQNFNPVPIHLCCVHDTMSLQKLESNSNPKQLNAIHNKIEAIKKYEHIQKINSECNELKKPCDSTKAKREPTVADLFKIIKLQNEQLKVLQEKVDKFITTNNSNTPSHTLKQPLTNVAHKGISVETIEENHHKISIGVMTSFEMVRTSTVLNRDILRHQNAQIQCNRSQISIKEVISSNVNILDGISHANKKVNVNRDDIGKVRLQDDNGNIENFDKRPEETLGIANEEKTLNELSLCNLHIDNAITPQLSPDQTLYLDVKDYSDSDSDDQSNVGWTYYNKIMTHVNEVLQDSQIPSSAGALYRNTGRCTQMNVDRTDVSVSCKRVKFGDDPLGLHRLDNLIKPSSDTSMQMNKLAAKYLKNSAAAGYIALPGLKTPATDVSLATRNYMEKHNLVPGKHLPRHSVEVPNKFLDITALKQQPKLL